MGLTYGGPNTNLILKGYYDILLGTNAKSEDQRSSYGWIFILGGCAISRLAKRHFTTSLSNAEVGLMAAKEAFAHEIHLPNTYRIPRYTTIKCHNRIQLIVKRHIKPLSYKTTSSA